MKKPVKPRTPTASVDDIAKQVRRQLSDFQQYLKQTAPEPASNKKRWALLLADELAAKHKTFPNAWAWIIKEMPKGSEGRRYDGYIISINEEDALEADCWAADHSDTLKKSTFRTDYFGPAARARKARN